MYSAPKLHSAPLALPRPALFNGLHHVIPSRSAPYRAHDPALATAVHGTVGGRCGAARRPGRTALPGPRSRRPRRVRAGRQAPRHHPGRGRVGEPGPLPQPARQLRPQPRRLAERLARHRSARPGRPARQGRAGGPPGLGVARPRGAAARRGAADHRGGRERSARPGALAARPGPRARHMPRTPPSRRCGSRRSGARRTTTAATSRRCSTSPPPGTARTASASTSPNGPPRTHCPARWSRRCRYGPRSRC